ncbi:MAG: DUF262 domain-containing protein [Crocinitomix sp.]|nr:DUF262 domain-containing protein [Crocinitomix sp.]
MKAKEDNLSKINFLAIEKIRDYHFVVEDYQRGYKWQQEQIEALLNDINKHKDGKYCLQPVIVNSSYKDNESTTTIKHELIDGQQRITSIYLLLYYLEQEKFYTIDYKTRDSTQEFLQNKMALLFAAIEADIEWDAFIETNKDFNNVDIYHIYLISSYIAKWFSNTKSGKEEFSKKIKQQAHIIWYDVFENEHKKSAEDIFLDLNAGKIPLTNSELIKALFVLDTQRHYSNEVKELKSFELTNEWDLIENQLQDDNFWFFICDHHYYDSLDTRIDFIIDLANEIRSYNKEQGKKAYLLYEEQYSKAKQFDWNIIKQTFNKLVEWYSDNENKEFYHYIGFLVNTGISNLSAILKLSKNSNKKEFKEKLIGKIQEEFKKVKKEDDKTVAYYQLDNLNYDKNRVACQNVLLLLNVELFNNDLSTNKFPFDLYKKEQWSVEHINPQNPKEFENIKAVIKWLNSFNKDLAAHKETELIKEIQQIVTMLSKEDKTKRIPEVKLKSDDSELLTSVIEKISNLMGLHDISNLTLLDKNTNSKLGNNVFIDKRKTLLELYSKAKEANVFIPDCTKAVFTKNYSKNKKSITDEVFGLQDMADYKEHINNQLLTFYLDK